MRVLIYNQLDSTNAEARRCWSPQHPETYAVVARTQSSGMGRNGRQWISPLGGMWLTVVWPLTAPLVKYQALPLVVGHALAEALVEFYDGALEPMIKWPNDILLGGGKVAGILCQTDSSLKPPAILIGVGLNGDFPKEAISAETRYPATTLLEQLAEGTEVCIDEFASAFLARLEREILDFEANGFASFHGAIWQRLAWRGEAVHATGPGGESIEGILEGIDEEGRLLLQRDNETLPYMSGELDRLSRPSV